MLCQWKQQIFYWEGLGNMTEKIYMMVIPIRFLSTSKGTQGYIKTPLSQGS